jgi:putative ABC transport system permease protein
MQSLLHDVRFALRQLRKSPGFALTAVLTLALGIGVNTAVFSIMDAVVFRPLAVPDLSRVVTVAEQQNHGDYQQVALANYMDWTRQSRSFERLAVWTSGDLTLTGAGDAARVQAAYASANFFDVMRVNPLLGRAFLDAETEPGKNNVAVLSYGFWRKHFGSDPFVAGRKIELNGRAYTVTGVMPQTMQYPSTADLFLPLAPSPPQIENRSAHDYLVTGRLRAGVTAVQAQAEMRGIADRLAKAYPATNQDSSVKVEPLLDDINGDLTPLYFRLVLGATLFVLLVVCINVANLQFARGIARRPELAMRTALGARRGRLLRQLLTENILLGLVGAAGGLLLAKLVLHVSIISMPDRVARYMAGWSNISLNGRALAFSLLLAVGGGIAAGFLPAIESMRINLVDQLKAGSRSVTGSGRTHRLRNIFAVAQIALAVALVIGAALMCKGMWAMLNLAGVYRPKQSLTFNVYLPPARYATAEKQAAFYKAGLEKLGALPGVTHAAITAFLPFGNDKWMDDFRIENRPLVPGKFQSAQRIAVSSDYFATVHIPIVSGRSFNSGDGLDTPRVAIISHKFAERYFPGEDPIGHRIRMGASTASEQPWARIVGISGDATYSWVDRETLPSMYLNTAQAPPSEGATYVVSTDGNPLALAPDIRRAMAALDPAVPLDAMQTYEQFLHEALTGLMNVAVWLGIDAFLALVLAAVGIFAVMANMVAERGREIGVRLTLGARREDILRMILGRAAVLTGAGVGLGIMMAAGMARMLANLLFGVRPGDPAVFVTTTVMIVLIALFASWAPARRAASVDPVESLRAE